MRLRSSLHLNYGLGNATEIGPFGFGLADFFVTSDNNYLYTYDTDSHYFLRRLGDGVYWAVGITPGGGLGYTVKTINQAKLCIPYKSVAQGDAAVTRGGSGWSSPIVLASSYGGFYYRTVTAGDYWEFTTPENTTAVGHRAYYTTNGGIALVSINGDTTAASNLSTAQDLVNSGDLESSALVANGGTLNPTDRVIDLSSSPVDDGGSSFYEGAADTAPSPDIREMFATGLSPNSYTVRVTCTGYKNPSSIDVRLYAAGVIYFSAGVTPETAGILSPVNGYPGGIYELANLSGSSVWEYALTPMPSGATNLTWVGNAHGYESQVGSLSLTVDGISETFPTEDTVVSGQSISVERTSQLFHPDIGAGSTAIADVVTTYLLSGFGLKISPSITWLDNGTQDGGYLHMYPFSTWADKGGNAGDLANSPVGLTDDNGSSKVQAESNLAYVWNSSSDYAGALYAPTPTNSGDAYNANDIISGNIMFIEDRADGNLNKIYLTRTGFTDGSAFSTNDVWSLSAMYLMTYIEGADSKLSGL